VALIVEDGTGIEDAESYLSVTEANSYHAAHGNSAWTGVDTVKEAALRKATTYLDGVYGSRWPGVKRTLEQALLWPRSYGYDREDYALADDAVPAPVQQATAELALRALSEELIADLERGGRISRVKVGPIEEEYERGASPLKTYPWIDAILDPLLARRGVLVRG
jgi:hypothetical protein